MNGIPQLVLRQHNPEYITTCSYEWITTAIVLRQHNTDYITTVMNGLPQLVLKCQKKTLTTLQLLPQSRLGCWAIPQLGPRHHTSVYVTTFTHGVTTARTTSVIGRHSSDYMFLQVWQRHQ
jgi:hypothetical protein